MTEARGETPYPRESVSGEAAVSLQLLLPSPNPVPLFSAGRRGGSTAGNYEGYSENGRES